MRARSSLILAFVTMAIFATPSFAVSSNGIVDGVGGVGIQEHLGAQVSIHRLSFRNETGHVLPLSTYFQHGIPVILAMVYYQCPNLCTFALNGLTDSLKTLRKNLGWTAGKRFDIVVVSINPKETPKLASSKKATYLESYDQGGGASAAAGWHFLTGEKSQISELASQMGFHYRAYGTQFAHSSAIYVLTPEGKISRYLYGIEYRPRDLRLALLEATHGKMGTFMERFLSLCYRYDPVSRHYVVAPNRIVAAGAGTGGAGTVLILGGFLAMLRRREKEKERD